MKINIPSKIQILGMDITVKIVKEVDKDESYGRAMLDKGEILILRGMTKDLTEITFWHEVMHFVHWLLAYEWSDEGRIDRLAQAMHQVVKQLEV